MFENIALSFRGIWNHKMRSFLTMLGIIIGIASIITIVSTIKGTNDQIKANLIGAGTNVVTVRLQMKEGYLDMEYSGNPEGIAIGNEDTITELEKIRGVEKVSGFRTRSWANGCYYQNTAYQGAVYGIDRKYLDVNNYHINYGRGFTDSDFTNMRKVCIVDTTAMSNLFIGVNPIGEIIELSGETFTVVGVAAQSPLNAPNIQNLNDYYMYSDTSGGKIFIPVDTWPVVYRYDEPMHYALKASSTDEMTTAGNDVAKALTEMLISNENYEYKADNLLEQASHLQSLTSSTNQQLIWIAGISLLVGGIGVMNIMLVSVTERTREIGLKKAIGARRRRILWQFLTEAGVLTGLGGLLGVAVGIGLAQMLANVMGTAVSISAPACVIAVGFSMVIGIVFGLIPAVKASRLNPIDALRRE